MKEFGCSLMLVAFVLFLVLMFFIGDVGAVEGTLLWIIFFVGVIIAAYAGKVNDNKADDLGKSVPHSREMSFEESEYVLQQTLKAFSESKFSIKLFEDDLKRKYIRNIKEEDFENVDNELDNNILVESEESIFETDEIAPANIEKDIEPNSIVLNNIFVDYNISIENAESRYPILRIPDFGCIVRDFSYGRSKKRGFLEESFQESIKNALDEYLYFEVSGNVCLNIKGNQRPYEPDIAIISNVSNIRIDVEIDEPYSFSERKPTHCSIRDLFRDLFFVQRGWIVLRFSEIQIKNQEESCLKFIKKLIELLHSTGNIMDISSIEPNLVFDDFWNYNIASGWEKECYREKYLNIENTDAIGVKNTNNNENKGSITASEIEQEKYVKSCNYLRFERLNKFVKDDNISINDKVIKLLKNLRPDHFYDNSTPDQKLIMHYTEFQIKLRIIFNYATIFDKSLNMNSFYGQYMKYFDQSYVYFNMLHYGQIKLYNELLPKKSSIENKISSIQEEIIKKPDVFLNIFMNV